MGMLLLELYDNLTFQPQQQFPVVPLFGDVQIALVTYLKMCPHFDGMREKWTAAADGAEDKVIVQYNLLGKMDAIREEHVKFISELARYNNEVITLVQDLLITRFSRVKQQSSPCISSLFSFVSPNPHSDGSILIMLRIFYSRFFFCSAMLSLIASAKYAHHYHFLSPCRKRIFSMYPY